MNKKFAFLSILAAVVLGAACVLLVKQLQSARERERAAAAAAQAEAAARVLQEDRLKEVERERVRVEKQNKELADLAHTLRESEAKQAGNATALAGRLKAASTDADTAPADASGSKAMGDMFQKMMKDPAMKEMIRNQQKAMMKPMYGALFKELNLDAEQQKRLTDLILDAQMAGAEAMGGALEGDGGSRTNAIAAIDEKQKALTEQVRTLLGAEKFAQYEDYQKTLGDRMVLSQFQQQSSGTETALRDDQMKHLVQLMKDERARTPPIISEDPSKTAQTMNQMLDGDTVERHFQWQEAYNKRIFEQAGQVLSPEQLKEFAEFQEQQLNMQKFGMKMAREMFGGTKEGGVPATPAVERRK